MANSHPFFIDNYYFLRYRIYDSQKIDMRQKIDSKELEMKPSKMLWPTLPMAIKSTYDKMANTYKVKTEFGSITFEHPVTKGGDK